LRSFGEALGFKTNYEKNVAYYSGASQAIPSWLGIFHWKWAQDGNISKFLGFPFGLGLKVGDISKFLLYKVKKKLAFWCSTHLSLAGRPLIVKQVLLYLYGLSFLFWQGLGNIYKFKHCYVTTYG
jgi:hypothetical protein